MALSLLTPLLRWQLWYYIYEPYLLLPTCGYTAHTCASLPDVTGSAAQQSSPSRKEPVRKSSAESQQVGEEFAEFLKALNRSDVALDVSKQVRAIIERIQSMGEVPIDEYSEVVVSFYQAMTDRIHTKPLYNGE